jgi:hypothetical protein
MSVIAYDPENWLVTLPRCLGSWVQSKFDSDLVTVEMEFPDTNELQRKWPLDKVLVHFQQDDLEHPVLGFGVPGVEEFVAGPGGVGGDWRLKEAQVHHVNYDVGVWCSAETGGETARNEVLQTLSYLFTLPNSRNAMRDETGGLFPQSFSGGRYDLDRINDQPVWRAMDMTLIVRAVERFVPQTFEVVPEGFDQDPELSISDDTGNQVPIT